MGASTSGVGEASTSGVGEALTSGVGEALTSGVGETSTSGVGEGCDRLLLTGLRFLGLGGDNSGVGVSFGDSGNTEGEEVGCDRSFVPKTIPNISPPMIALAAKKRSQGQQGPPC